MVRKVALAVCALLQVASVTPGGSTHDGGATALASVAGLAAAIALWRWPHDARALLGVTGAYVVQAAVVGPVVPAVVAAGVLLVAARVRVDGGVRSSPRQLSPAAVAVAVVGVPVTCVAVGAPSTALSYAVVLLAATVAGLLVGAQHERDRQRLRDAVDEERLRIARDLHDVVGHGMTAIAVQAGAGRLALDAGQLHDARTALASVETAGRQVLREVRWLVGLLRNDDRRPALVDVEALVDAARRCGAAASLTTSGRLVDASPEVGEAAYRIVQEALTNSLRHAPDEATAVCVDADTQLTLDVANRATNDGHGSGSGVNGMRERAAAVGGTVDIGLQDGCWRVHAVLPLRLPTPAGGWR